MEALGSWKDGRVPFLTWSLMRLLVAAQISVVDILQLFMSSEYEHF